MTPLMKVELVTMKYATTITAASTPATQAAINSVRRSQLRCFSMAGEVVVAIKHYFLAAWGHCVSERTRAAVSASAISRFYTVKPDYSMQIKPEVPLKTGTRHPFSLPRFPPANIF
jgi:hypothetical protein